MVETGNKYHDHVSRLISWAHWFTFFNLIIVSLISLRYIAYDGLSDSAFGIAYQFLSLIGHFSFLSAVVFILLLFPLAFIIPIPRLYRVFAIIICTIAITFLIVDTQIFRIYSYHLNPLIWQFLQNPEQVEKIYSINLHYISFPIIFVIELFISYFIWIKCRKIQAKGIGKLIAAFLFSTFILTHLIYIWADATQYRPITQQQSLYPLSYPMTARTFLTRQGWLTDQKELQGMGNNQLVNPSTNKSMLRYPVTPIIYPENAALSTPKNILFITVGALRADMLNAQNMPFSYQLSRQGLNYKRHFSGGDDRALGLFSLFYALPNTYWGDITKNHVQPLLMERLINLDYQFGLVSSIGFMQPEFLNSSFSQVPADQRSHFSSVQNNKDNATQWKRWFSTQSESQAWFSFVYLKPEKDLLTTNKSTNSLSERSDKIDVYQEHVLAIDRYIEEIVSTLQKNNVLENTIVFITGSHGASFEKENRPEAAIKNTHTPLIVLWPEKDPAQITRMTSHLDIVPTLIGELFSSQTRAAEYSIGQSLFEINERKYILSGNSKKHVIYENDKITQFSNDGEINSIDWQGNKVGDKDDVDITLLIDVLDKLRHFYDN